MPEKEPFQSDRSFYALDQYPYGIGRSGEFTEAHAQLLEDHGWAYQELDQCVRTPDCQEETNFLLVCQGKRKPQTDHEIAWRRFCDKTGSVRAVLRNVSSVQMTPVEDLGESSIDLDF